MKSLFDIRNRQKNISLKTKNKINKQIKNDNDVNNNESFKMFIAPKMTCDEVDPNLTPLMKNNIMKHPFSANLIGLSGVGKTNMLLFLMKSPYCLGGYYKKDNIYLLSWTAKCDESFKMLDIKKSNLKTGDPIDELDKILTELTKNKEKKGKKTEPKLIIIEDATADNRFLRSVPLKKASTALRHLDASFIIMTHQFKALESTSRNQMHDMLIFPVNSLEIEKIRETYQPNGMSKETFYGIVEDAFTPDEYCKRPFLFINGQEYDVHKKFMKGFYKYLIW